MRLHHYHAVLFLVAAAYPCCRLPCRRSSNGESFGGEQIEAAKHLDPYPEPLKEEHQDWARKDLAGECGDPTCKRSKPSKASKWNHCRKCGKLFHPECLTKEQLFKDGKTCQVCKRCSRDLRILQEEFLQNEERFDEQVKTGKKKENEKEQNKTDIKQLAAARCFIGSAKDEGHSLTLTFKPPHREPPTGGGESGGGMLDDLGSTAQTLNGIAKTASKFAATGAAIAASTGVGAPVAAGLGAFAAAAKGVEMATDVVDHSAKAADAVLSGDMKGAAASASAAHRASRS